MRALILLPLMACTLAYGQDDAGVEASEWQFAATLNGKPIGTHRFVVSGGPRAHEVQSDAQFVVRVLGIPVYHYRHHAHERWEGDCLRALRSETDDAGEHQQVDQRFDTDCLMSFAYWNPLLVMQRRLVDPQTGRIEAVRFERVNDLAIEVRGQPVPARGWRLISMHQRITVWYAADDGRWVGLDAEVKGGRLLSYRLLTAPAVRP